MKNWGIDLNLEANALVMDSDHCMDIFCLCGFKGGGDPMRQHMECPRCNRVVEACCEGVPQYY